MNFFKIIILTVCTFESISAITFNCTFQIRESRVNGYVYSCDAKVLNVENKVLTEVRSSLPPNKKFLDVQHVFIHDCGDLTYIPKGMNNFFPNLVSMHLYKCGIEKLYNNDLKEYPDLKLFGIKENKISKIPSNFFANTPKVNEIYFTGNKIKSVGKNVTEHLMNLTYADFGGNICINQLASSPKDIETLKEKLLKNCTSMEEENDEDEEIVTTTVIISEPLELTTTVKELSENPDNKEILVSNELKLNESINVQQVCNDNINGMICDLKNQIAILLEKNSLLSSKIDEISTKLEKIIKN